MPAVSLRVPHSAPVSPSQWQTLVGVPGGSWASININAVYYNGNTYFGYTAADNTIRVAQYHHATHTVTISPSIVSSSNQDDHSAPAVLVRQSDHKILVATPMHGLSHMYVALSSNAEDVTSWGAPTDIASTLAGGGIYTYANLFQLSGEAGKIYLIFRDGDTTTTAKWAYSTSTDGGTTWTAETLFFSAGANKGPYMGLDYDGVSRIDFVVSDGNVYNNGSNCSLYHFYYSGGSYFKSDGTLISSALPLGPSDATKIHDGTTSGALGTTMQISKKSGNLYVAYSAANTSGLGVPMNFWYAVWNGSSWTKTIVTDTAVNGSDHGICLSRDTPDTTIFLGRVVSGASRVERYQTLNGGSTWAVDDITGTEIDPGQVNTGPISPLNAVPTLETLWVYGNFGPSFFLTSQIRGFPNWQNT